MRNYTYQGDFERGFIKENLHKAIGTSYTCRRCGTKFKVHSKFW